MKKTLLSISLVLISFLSNAQVFDVDTLNWTGSVKNRVNYVILADGYTSSSADQTKLKTDAQKIVTSFFNTIPYKEYKNYVNFILVKVISKQSGASHPKNSSDNDCGSQPAATVDNYFGSSFDCGGGNYHRLLCTTKDNLIPGVMASNWPTYDQVLIIVNTPYYGGAGGQYATTSTDASGVEIAIHEVGHSFGTLADEYWAGSQYATNSLPNMTNVSSPTTVKWKHWVGLQSVGVYPYTGSGSSGWYKPVNGTCKMEYLGSGYPFCPVCRETHVEKFHKLVRPYDTLSPVTSKQIDVTNKNIDFKLNTVLPTPNTLKITWTLNGVVQKSVQNLSLNSLAPSALKNGSNTLIATILDTTAYARVTSHATQHKYIVTWDLNYSSATGLDIVTQHSEIEYILSPNPVTEFLTFKGKLPKAETYTVLATDIKGTQIKLAEFEYLNLENEVKIPVFQLSKGIYIIDIVGDNGKLITEKIVVE